MKYRTFSTSIVRRSVAIAVSFTVTLVAASIVPKEARAQETSPETSSGETREESESASSESDDASSGGATPTGESSAAAPESSDEDEAPSPLTEGTTSASTSSDAEGDVLGYEKAVEIAVAHNHGLEIARRRTEIAERNVSIGNANFLPNLEAVASQNRTFGGPGLFGSGNIFTQTQFGVQLDWLMFGGFGRLARYDRLKAERSARQLRTEAEIESTLVEATTAYWRVVRDRRILEAIRETRELSKQRLEIARSRRQAGTGSQVDVNLARVELNRDRSSMAEQRIALREAKSELNRILGRPPSRTFRVDGTLTIADSLQLDQLRDRAMRQNRQLRALRENKQVATEQIDEVRADKWPDLGLTLGYNYTEFHGGFFPPFETVPTFEYGVTLTVPLFEGLNVLRRVDNAQTERVIADTEIRQERTRIRSELTSAYEAYRQHRERADLARRSIETARQNVEIALTQFEAGTITQVELRQVQVNLLDARTRLIEARFEAKRAELELKQLAGELYGEWL